MFEAMVQHVQYRDFSAVASLDVSAEHLGWARPGQGTWLFFELQVTRTEDRGKPPRVLRRELARPSWTGEYVAIGTATDCYQPIEGHYKLTRGALEALVHARNPAGIVTKGPMIVRDRDLLVALSSAAACTVYMSVPTVDERAWELLEPGTAPPLQRLRAVRDLVDAGVNAGVLMNPIVPGLSSSRAKLERIALSAGVKAPSGDYNAKDISYQASGPVERPVGLMIQPGDGGWGVGRVVPVLRRLLLQLPAERPNGLYAGHRHVTRRISVCDGPISEVTGADVGACGLVFARGEVTS